jgi:hypothetical protein
MTVKLLPPDRREFLVHEMYRSVARVHPACVWKDSLPGHHGIRAQ